MRESIGRDEAVATDWVRGLGVEFVGGCVGCVATTRCVVEHAAETVKEHEMERRAWRLAAVAWLMSGCGGTPLQPEPEEPTAEEEAGLRIVEYEKKTRELLETNAKLNTLRGTLDEQRRRLSIICNDYPDHDVCAPQTAAQFARRAFCSDEEFTRHVDGIVSACHQGMCKQVDQAELLSRGQYMTLTQRLPHSLITFKAKQTRLDGSDKRRIQQFVENMHGEQGYVIIVGRASRDGPWRKNLQYAIERAEHTRQFIVDEMGLDSSRVGYITYGHDKMYLTKLDTERFSERRLSTKQANRSALVFSYPCYDPNFDPGPSRAVLPNLPRPTGAQ